MSNLVCKGHGRVVFADASSLGGWGVSFGRFNDAIAADAMLTGRLVSTRDLFSGGDSGVVRVPGTKEYVAVVWSLRQPETLSLCNYLRERNAHCEVVPPEAFEEFARQASLLENATPARKAKKRKSSNK
jgi:hypothetical protein